MYLTQNQKVNGEEPLNLIKMNKDSKIYVAGHRGLLGSAILKKLKSQGYTNIIYRTHAELDLQNQADTFDFISKEKPEFIFLSAAKVGGIKANIDSPAEFLYSNLQIQNNVIEAARRFVAKKLLFVGSSCIYPREAACPIRESALLTGLLEPTNEGYALAKIAGIRMCQFYRKQYGCDFISAIPANLFGPGDHYDLEKSHLVPALILKIHRLKMQGKSDLQIWGSGNPRREFMLSDDCADALCFLFENYSDSEPVNVGTGTDLTVTEIALAVAKILGVDVKLNLDPTKPDGMMRKVLNVDKMKSMGWSSKISFEEGIRVAYEDFLDKGYS